MPWILLGAIFSTIMVLFEDQKRIDDYSVFLFPRVFQGLWYVLMKKYYLKELETYLSYVFAVCVALIYYLKKYHFKEIPFNYLRQYEFFFGKN